MKKIVLVSVALGFLSGRVFAGPAGRASLPVSDRNNRLVDTRLAVRLDYERHFLLGKEWVTLRPAVPSTDSLRLDAKGMLIQEVALLREGRKTALHYSYDGGLLAIALDKRYTPAQTYTVFIDYTARPDVWQSTADKAGNSKTKGLYFINSDGKDKNKPVEVWTQGEPDGSSVWFPTIDDPGQKTLETISITVPSQYVSLSNGRLISQRAAGAGWRTDTWKMEKPHAPYLFMLAVGDFSVYKDKWENKEVDYYLEKAFAPYAKQIFGNTPQMIGFFSAKLGVPYPWSKYSQVVVRDYDADGGMENTTATLLGESLLRTPGVLRDENYDQRESAIAHELFHQWFGDYVTCKDWADLTVNESFGCLAETLWAEYKYGSDEGRAHIYQCLQQYLGAKGANTRSLVRPDYGNVQELFDAVTYQKGACVLYMLRDYLTEPVFYRGLHLFLVRHAYNTAGASDLRKAFEKASGKDLRWFFDQWYLRPGTPQLAIRYGWDEANKTELVYLTQTQPGQSYILPMAVDVYVNKQRRRYNIVMNGKTDTLRFRTVSRPDLVNIDADKSLLVDKDDHQSTAGFVALYDDATNLIDRQEALTGLAEHQDDPAVQGMLKKALADPYYGLRAAVIANLDLKNEAVRDITVPILRRLALHDGNSEVRKKAIQTISGLKDSSDRPLYLAALDDSSYQVRAAALNALAGISGAEAFREARRFERDNQGDLTIAMAYLYGAQGSDEQAPFVLAALEHSDLDSKFEIAKAYTQLLSRINTTNTVEAGIERIRNLAIHYNFFGVGKYAVKWLRAVIAKKQDAAAHGDEELKQRLGTQIDFISGCIADIQRDKGYRPQ